jgi:hypothetical protein
MLISDEFKVPYESLADWTALLVSSVVYAGWSVLTLLAWRRFAERTSMKILASVIGVLFLATGVVLYGLVFLKVDALAYRAAVRAALPHLTSARFAELLTTHAADRAWSLIRAPSRAGLRGLAFLTSPFFAVVVAILVVRAKHSVKVV